MYFMLDVVRTLDLSAITRRYEQEDRGFPPYHPRGMVTLLLYSYGLGVYSSRRIQKLCERDAAYRVIVRNDGPNFRTISGSRAVCNEEQVILAADVTDQANDKRQVQPMASPAQRPTPNARGWWSRSSDRSNRGADFASFCGAAWRKCAANGV